MYFHVFILQIQVLWYFSFRISFFFLLQNNDIWKETESISNKFNKIDVSCL
jgi:hypothetical protein